MNSQSAYKDAIAIIGMGCRFPGSVDPDEYWKNVAAGVCSIRNLSTNDLLAAGVDADLATDPAYVSAVSRVEEADLFDAEFFGIHESEAAFMDPQRRLMLMCAHEALEQAGYGSANDGAIVGVYAGISHSTYPFGNLLSKFGALSGQVSKAVDAPDLLTIVSNGKEFISTYLSYRLDLTGPSINVNTACSTSLVAIQQAARSLASRDCDMALAGGSAIFPYKHGYRYSEGGILSPDGRCYAFDERANGAIFGDGVGMVVLKRMEDALAAGDTIHAVIRGSAINNDGKSKMNFAAPSVSGQMEVIAEALIASDTPADSVSYVETHGTGTPLGDPIEVEALTQAFRISTRRKQFCAIGSVKPNIGHPDAASGVAGLIKTVEALKHRQLPPSINYAQPNAQIDFASSPFYVNTQLRDWPSENGPRRAGVSSFGIGGTNVHVVLEEAPPVTVSAAVREAQVLVLSARTATALKAASDRLAGHLEAGVPSLADVAYTLQVGRRRHAHRRVVVGRSAAECAAALRQEASVASMGVGEETSLVWMFPGQGTQHVDMFREQYADEPVFRAHLDACAEALAPTLGLDLREVLYPSEASRDEATRQLAQTWLGQPALFAVEYSLARLLESYGLQPAAMIGHSLGEFVAACLAGVFSLEDGLRLVSMRGRLMQSMEPGRMLSVHADEASVRLRLDKTLSVAAVNGPGQTVVAGPADVLEAFGSRLAADDVQSMLLETSHAFHSSMMEPMLADWREVLEGVTLQAPSRAYVSNVTGTWIQACDATDPAYWVAHLRGTVRFAAGLDSVYSASSPLAHHPLLVEVGPGQVLSRLARGRVEARGVVALHGAAGSATANAYALHEGIGQLWAGGAHVDWLAYHGHTARRRVPLPTYPFERQRYWIDADAKAGHAMPDRSARLAWNDWFSVPSWQLSHLPGISEASPGSSYLYLADEADDQNPLVKALRTLGANVFPVTSGDAYTYDRLGATIDMAAPAHYTRLLDDMRRDGWSLTGVVHAFGLRQNEHDRFSVDAEVIDASLSSVLYLVQALGERMPGQAMRLNLLARNLARVIDGDKVHPEVAMLSGISRVIPREFPSTTCRVIDMGASHASGQNPTPGWERGIASDLLGASDETHVAWRGNQRWVRTYQRVTPGTNTFAPLLRQKGAYLITGGLGGIGLAIADYLATAFKARLVLVSRSGMPPRENWSSLVALGSDTALCALIARIWQMESHGAEVLVVRADIADANDVRQVSELAVAHFGSINGVFHAAGLAGDGTIVNKTSASMAPVLRPKVFGTVALAHAMEASEPDFFILCSSMSAISGGVGQYDYAAANAFQDAFAVHMDGLTRTRYISIGWDAWKDVGMAANMRLPAHLLVEKERHLRSAIGTDEGIRALLAVLGDPLPHWVVSPRDLALALAAPETEKVRPDTTPHVPRQVTLKPRPQLSNAYVAPSDPIEITMASIWQELLSFESIGVADNFFELGGDSILITRLHTMMRNRLPDHMQDVALKMLFEYPTISGISAVLSARHHASEYAGHVAVLRTTAPVVEEGEI